MQNWLVAVGDQVLLRETGPGKAAGGGARTHTALRPLDFESSASASSATPAPRNGAKEYELPAEAQTVPIVSSGCKLRGGPKISRRMMACRKPDADLSRVAKFVSARCGATVG